jgi:hypothetical protein
MLVSFSSRTTVQNLTWDPLRRLYFQSRDGEGRIMLNLTSGKRRIAVSWPRKLYDSVGLEVLTAVGYNAV